MRRHTNSDGRNTNASLEAIPTARYAYPSKYLVVPGYIHILGISAMPHASEHTRRLRSASRRRTILDTHTGNLYCLLHVICASEAKCKARVSSHYRIKDKFETKVEYYGVRREGEGGVQRGGHCLYRDRISVQRKQCRCHSVHVGADHRSRGRHGPSAWSSHVCPRTLV